LQVHELCRALLQSDGALMLAARSEGSQLDMAGACACVLLLLERGCDYNLRDKFKCTALHRAAGL
jgi:hypothetical protein